MNDCSHMIFSAHVAVNRLTSDDEVTVKAFSADVRIKCSDCGMPFTFRGLPLGVSQIRPTVSVGGQEARMPIEPLSVTMLRETPVGGQA